MNRSAWLLILAAAVFVTGIGLLFASIDDDSVATDTTIPADSSTTTTTTVPASTGTTGTTETIESNSRFIEGRCEFDKPPGYDVDCGWLLAPEDRSDPDNGNTVQLHVAIFHTKADGAPDDPIVYLEGGPGGDALEAIPFTFAQAFAPFLDNRDFIMFDQRGTGFSSPSLECFETTELAYEQLDDDLTTEEALAANFDALQEQET